MNIKTFETYLLLDFYAEGRVFPNGKVKLSQELRIDIDRNLILTEQVDPIFLDVLSHRIAILEGDNLQVLFVPNDGNIKIEPFLVNRAIEWGSVKSILLRGLMVPEGANKI